MRQLVATCALVFAIGCVDKLDTTREVVDDGTFGDALLTLACKRVAFLEDRAAFERGDAATIDVSGDTYRDVCRLGLAPPNDAHNPLKALLAERDDLVAAVDTMFPEDFLQTLQTFLTTDEFLTLYDQGPALTAVDKLSETLDVFAAETEMTSALARMSPRVGYRPGPSALGVVREVLAYPELHELLLVFGDAVTDGGVAKESFDELNRTLAATLRGASESTEPLGAETTLSVALDLLLAERAELGTGRPLQLVRRDPRGVASVAGLPAMFADTDGDGLADLDGNGRFVDANGQPFDAPTPFLPPQGEVTEPWPHRDSDGRALTDEDGELIYRYVDLDRTVAGALARDAADLVDPSRGTAFDLVRGASALIGPRLIASRELDNGETIQYRGYDTGSSPLLDMVHGLLVLGTDPNAYDVLDYGRALLRDHPAAAAQLMEALIDTARTADRFPQASLITGSPFWDDMQPVLRSILSVPGLAEDLVRALEDPVSAELPLRFADHMTTRDMITLDPDTQETIGRFQTQVDRSVDDSGGNRSVFQRLLHLIANSRGVPLCNKQGARITDPLGLGIPLQRYDECELMEIDDLAVFYVQAIAFAKNDRGEVIFDDGVPRRKARLDLNYNNILIEAIVNDDLLEDMVGIEGFRSHPTPEALNRSLFLDPMPTFLADVMDPARDSDGDRFIDAHPGTLMAWELDGFYDQIRPIVQAFADHNSERLFVDLLAVLHDHYPTRDSLNHQQGSREGKGYAFASALNSYEPLIADVLRKRVLFNALVENAPVLNGITAGGKAGPTVLADLGRFLVLPRSGLSKRDGSTTTVTEDGRQVEVLSPWYVLADAFSSKRKALDVADGEGDAWRSAVSNTADLLLRGEDVVGRGWRFRNPRVAGVGLALLDFAEGRLRVHDGIGDRAPWLTAKLPTDLADVVSGPLFAGAADFVLTLQQTPETRRQLEGALRYVLDEVANDRGFQVALTSLADLMQLALSDEDLVPVLHAVGEALRPERGVVAAQLDFATAAVRSDRDRALVTMLRNMFEESRPGRTAVGDLIDGIAEVNRANPYDDLGRDLSAADYSAVMTSVARFLDDEKRGLRKFIAIIRERNL